MTANICREREQCERKIKSLVELAADRLPLPADQRNQDISFAEIVDQIEKNHNEVESKRNQINKEIKRLENRLGGLFGTKYSNGFGFFVNCLSFLVGVFSIAQIALEKLIPIEDEESKRGIGIGFAASIVVFGILFIFGNTIHYIGRRAWQKRHHYKELNWDEKKDLKKFIKMFKEIVSINSESDEENLKHKFKILLEDLPEMPKKYEGVPILRKRDDLISYILLSHPRGLELLEQFDSNIPPSEQPEPEITTFPRQMPSDPYRSFVNKTIERKQFEGHLTSGSAENLSPLDINYLEKNYNLCKKWLAIESYVGQSVPYLRIRGKRIKRGEIFREVDYNTFKQIYNNSEILSDSDSSSGSVVDLEAQQ
jgi:hypothetical protein